MVDAPIPRNPQETVPRTTHISEIPTPPSIEDRHDRSRSIQVLKRDGGDTWCPARVTISDPHGSATQQLRRLAFRVRELADARNARSIVVTSAQMGDGKTTTICNLAVQLARLDQALRVVLVDLDLRRSSVASAMGIQVDVPVDAVLRGEHPVGDAIIETDVPGLSVLALNQLTPNVEWLLANANLHTMIRELESRFNFVLIDTPPLLAVTDAQIILRHAAAGLFLARAGATRVKSIRRAIELLPTQKLLGSFLNATPTAQQASDYPYYSNEPSRDDADATHVD